MKAIILNSGIGIRMRPLTDEDPKCLVKLNGENILEHEIKNLVHYGIKDVIITVGPFEDKIRKFVRDTFPEANITYVKSDRYKSTNYIYSMWLTKDMINDDIILMHGDMVFEKELLGKLLKSTHKNCALVNNKIELPKKDFKGRIKSDKVKEIGVNVFGKDAFFLAPVYKFSKDDFRLWLNEIEKFIERDEVKVYAEDAFNNISGEIALYPVYYEDEFCMEIDNFDDLEIARKFFKFNKI